MTIEMMLHLVVELTVNAGIKLPPAVLALRENRLAPVCPAFRVLQTGGEFRAIRLGKWGWG